jgi:hypothetical protein
MPIEKAASTNNGLITLLGIAGTALGSFLTAALDKTEQDTNANVRLIEETLADFDGDITAEDKKSSEL